MGARGGGDSVFLVPPSRIRRSVIAACSLFVRASINKSINRSMATMDGPPAPTGAEAAGPGTVTPTRTPEGQDTELDAELVADLHDAFGMMYAGSEWDSDDEVCLGLASAPIS